MSLEEEKGDFRNSLSFDFFTNNSVKSKFPSLVFTAWNDSQKQLSWMNHSAETKKEAASGTSPTKWISTGSSGSLKAWSETAALMDRECA